jgi:hypothetical protein
MIRSTSPVPGLIRVFANKCDVQERAGSANDPFIMMLWDRLGVHPQNDEDLEWCGAAMDWGLGEMGFPKPSDWLNPKYQAAAPVAFTYVGVSIPKPVSGAIGIRKKDGKWVHVTCVLGVSDDGKTMFAIGGNMSGGQIAVVKASTADYVFRWPDPVNPPPTE